MLVQLKLREPATRTPGTTPCEQERCKTSPFICTDVSMQRLKSKMNITKQFNCQTYDIMYVIHCTKCAKLYIGKTEHTLNTCFKEHLADIKHHHHRDKPVVNHFNQAVHFIHNICVKGLWLLFMDNASDRKDMESRLIDKLGIRRLGGMNEKL